MEEIHLQKFRERYSHIHPLIFNRSCFYATSLGDLFDILEDVPQNYPLKWNDKDRKWVVVDNVYKLGNV